MSVVDNKPHDGRSDNERLQDEALRSSNWIKQNHPENGDFIVYWKNVNSPRDGGATFDESEGEGLRWKWFYKDGKQHGKSHGWYPNGKIKHIGYSDNGLRVGIWEEWYPDGQKWVEKKYKNGKQHGKWTYWHQNGKVSAIGYHYYGKK